jgi:4-aminobutyrate aminotransferase-like enzyme
MVKGSTCLRCRSRRIHHSIPVRRARSEPARFVGIAAGATARPRQKSAPGNAPVRAVDYLAAVESSARTYAAHFPQLFTSARGVRTRDADGREYIDCLSNAGTLALGHNHPEVQEAVYEFLELDQLQQALDLAAGR